MTFWLLIGPWPQMALTEGSADAADAADAPTFGLYLPQVNRDYQQLLAMAQAAEGCGFSAVWFMDHLALPGVRAPILEGWTLSTAVAAATSRIRVGHLVLCDSFRHPALLGRMAATLDLISGGRLNLGLGWGSSKADLRLLGHGDEPAAARAARLRESIGVIRAVMAGYPRSEGGYPPLFIGGASERTLDLVREHADWWNCPAMERHRLTQLVPHVGGARISVNYSIALAGRPGDRSYPLVGPAGHIARVMCEDRKLGVDHFIIQLTDPAATHVDVEQFMAEIAPVVRDQA